MEKISHPFIIKMHSCFESKRRIFFVLEFAAGGSLRYHYNKKRKFTLSEAKFYAAEVLLGLEHLHKQGYMYRDLKMENILIDAEGHVKLVDFGIAKKINEKPEERIPMRTDTFCGTPEYLAPEVKLRQQYSKSVDFWSFGVLLYTMVYGRLPDISRDSTKFTKTSFSSMAKSSMADRFTAFSSIDDL